MNSANFRRLIECLESEWAQTQPTWALKIASRMAKKDGAHCVHCWLGLPDDLSPAVFHIIKTQCPADDIRDKFKGIAAELRDFCAQHQINLEKAA